MKHIFISVLLAMTIIGCGVSDPKKSTMKVNKATAIKVQSIIPYKKGAPIATNIKNECKINKQLSEFIEAYALGENVGVVRKASLKRKSKGKVLLVNITNAVSSGNAFIGHRKYVSIKGTLYNNGKKQASFTGTRFSGGGMWAGFKGSCSVLGRTVKALGSDVSLWLKHPVDGVHLGDAI